MNIDRVETELAIDMGKFVYEAAKGAIGAFDSPYAAMKYVVGELDKHGELKLEDEKVCPAIIGSNAALKIGG